MIEYRAFQCLFKEVAIGFTFILLLACLALTGLAVIAFRSGRKALGGGALAVMAVGTAVLGYLWVTSPM